MQGFFIKIIPCLEALKKKSFKFGLQQQQQQQ
jgi:hypothetical protein